MSGLPSLCYDVLSEDILTHELGIKELCSKYGCDEKSLILRMRGVCGDRKLFHILKSKLDENSKPIRLVAREDLLGVLYTKYSDGHTELFEIIGTGSQAEWSQAIDDLLEQGCNDETKETVIVSLFPK